MHIELVGAPGSGKTTLKNLLCSGRQPHSNFCFVPQESGTMDFFMQSLSSDRKKLLHSLRWIARRRFDGIFRNRSLDFCKNQSVFSVASAELLHCEEAYIVASAASESPAGRLRALSHFHSTMIDYSSTLLLQKLEIEKYPKKVINVFDEGFYQRVFSLFDIEAPRHLIFNYCSAIPKPDLTILLKLDASFRRSRLSNRGNSNAGSRYLERDYDWVIENFEHISSDPETLLVVIEREADADEIRNIILSKINQLFTTT